MSNDDLPDDHGQARTLFQRSVQNVEWDKQIDEIRARQTSQEEGDKEIAELLFSDVSGKELDLEMSLVLTLKRLTEMAGIPQKIGNDITPAFYGMAMNQQGMIEHPIAVAWLELMAREDRTVRDVAQWICDAEEYDLIHFMGLIPNLDITFFTSFMLEQVVTGPMVIGRSRQEYEQLKVEKNRHLDEQLRKHGIDPDNPGS